MKAPLLANDHGIGIQPRMDKPRAGKDLWAIVRKKMIRKGRKNTTHMWAAAMKNLREKIEIETRRKINFNSI